MTNALIATVVAAAATFIAAGFVIQFALTGSQTAQDELRGGVKIDTHHDLYQLIMYDSLIAYNCDDSAAAGKLDNTGEKYWDDWKTYKEAANLATGFMGGGAENNGPTSKYYFTFQDLNNSFPGDQLKCYGTGTSIGGHGIAEAINPSSREWRNDQEGEHSRIRFTVNISEDDGPLEIGACFWFDQPAAAGFIDDSPDNGWSGPSTSGGITDMVYVFTDAEHVNRFDARKQHSGECTRGPAGVRYFFDEGGSSSFGASNGQKDGPALTVNIINNDDNPLSNPLIKDSHGTYSMNGDIPGPDEGGTIDIYSFELCQGTRGYVQTNTGFTDDDPNTATVGETGGGQIDYEKAPEEAPYEVGYDLPGRGDKEKFSNQNDPADNSLHPFIVIEKYTC